MSKTYDEAEALVKHLQEKGYEAKNVHIELENAITWANILVPANGTIGNQIFRTLVYFGCGQMLCVPTLFADGKIYEDDSRNEKDFYPHLVSAAAWANMKKTT
jgi:predicted methyltransferase MtxX (methanogen marker protein 4)